MFVAIAYDYDFVDGVGVVLEADGGIVAKFVGQKAIVVEAYRRDFQLGAIDGFYGEEAVLVGQDVLVGGDDLYAGIGHGMVVLIGDATVEDVGLWVIEIVGCFLGGVLDLDACGAATEGVGYGIVVSEGVLPEGGYGFFIDGFVIGVVDGDGGGVGVGGGLWRCGLSFGALFEYEFAGFMEGAAAADKGGWGLDGGAWTDVAWVGQGFNFWHVNAVERGSWLHAGNVGFWFAVWGKGVVEHDAGPGYNDDGGGHFAPQRKDAGFFGADPLEESLAKVIHVVAGLCRRGGGIAFECIG